MARRKFDEQGSPIDTHGDYLVTTRLVAAEQGVPLLDLGAATSKLLSRMGNERSKRLFDWIPAGEMGPTSPELRDDTHFNAFGASRICDLAVEEIRSHVPDLAPHLLEPHAEMGLP